jgi:hypothetical protein
VNYQGVLRSASGAALNGAYNMVFRLYDAPTGGNEIIVDRHTSLDGGPVTVTAGLFNVPIGSGSLLDGGGPGAFTELRSVFKTYTSVYLEIQVEAEILIPRSPIASAPYAIGGAHGVVYTRWGKGSCPAGATLVYSGYPAGGSYTSNGGPANPVCLASAPNWTGVPFNDANNTAGSLWGTEFVSGVSGIASIDALANEDPLCAVCYRPDADVSFEYPGSSVCPEGWNREYYGYMTGNLASNAGPTETVCMDIAPDVRPGGSADQNGFLWYTLEAVCGSLPCPPYVANREISCSVCTR